MTEIQSVLKESRVFSPPEAFRARAQLKDAAEYEALYKRSVEGKIMRRLLRDIAAGNETVGDTTTLEDYSVLAKLREDEE